MNHIKQFKIFLESYLDNIDFDLDFKHEIFSEYVNNLFTGKKKQEGHRYKFYIDDTEFTVDFIKYPPYYRDYDTGYERIYYTEKEYGFPSFKQNLGIDPRKIIIAVTKVTIDFLERVNPKSLHIDNIHMKGERRSNRCKRCNGLGKINGNRCYLCYGEGKISSTSWDREPSKRNKINYYYLSKMLPTKWKMLRGPQEIHIYQGDSLHQYEIPTMSNGVPLSELKPSGHIIFKSNKRR